METTGVVCKKNGKEPYQNHSHLLATIADWEKVVENKTGFKRKEMREEWR